MYQEACSHFKAFCVDKDVLEGHDEVTALLLSLGVDLADVPKSLTLTDLFQILIREVDQADPVDGICTELADEFD